MVRTSAYFVLRELFKSGGTKLYAAVIATLAAMAVSLILTPGVAHAYEVHLSVKGAGKVTEITNRGLIASDCTPGGTSGLQSPNTTPTGTVGNSCSPGSPGGLYASGDIVEYKAEPLQGFSLVGWRNADDSSTYKPVLCDGSNNSPDYLGTTATNCRFQIWENLKAQAVFADTTDPPSPSITGMSPQSGFTSGAITFSFSTSYDPTLKGFQCSIDSLSSWQSCSSGQSFTASEGTHTLNVRSIDWSGNISSISANRQWTVDKTAPNTTLDPGVGPQPGSTVESTDAVFQFSSSEPTNATFECNLTGPGLTSTSFTPCNTSPNTSTTKSYTNLKDGSYTFKVRAKDQAGNVDAAPDQRQWTVRNAPTVVESSLIPTKLQTGVSRNTNVSATFSEAMATISLKEPDNTSKTFKLQQYNKKKKTWKTIPATVSLSSDGKTATLDPYGATEPTGTETPLAANKKFRAVITTGAKDLEGNPMTKQFIWTFTTGDN